MLRQRQHNVQELNARDEQAIVKTAEYWRKTPLPLALQSCGEERGVVWSKSIVLKLDIDFPGMPRLFGQLLDQHERFVAFEIGTDRSHRVIERVDSWTDVTAAQNTSLHNPGTGMGRGAIALKVLRALNTEVAGGIPDDRPPNKSLERTREG
jgi:hypothetical protein